MPETILRDGPAGPGMVQRWVMELDDFADDNAIVNDGILTAIIQEWFEEANPL